MGFATKEMTGEEKVLTSQIGLRIAELRASKDLTRKEFAKLSNLHLQYLYDVELGKRNVTIYVLAKVARALNMSLSKLLKDIELDPFE